MKRKWIARLLTTVGLLSLVWIAMTLWVESKGPSRSTEFTISGDSLDVLIVYDPDPIYNLDEQICISIAKGLNEEHVNATVVTVRATDDLDLHQFDAVVTCANTYNWAPDAAVTSFIKEHTDLKSMPVVAVTLGSGSTAESSRHLKDLLQGEGIELLNDHEWWLMRPNDESRLKEKNVDVANDQAFAFGQTIASQLILRRD